MARQIVEYLRGLMLIQMGNANQVEATADVKKQMQSHARSFSTSDVLRMMKSFNNAATDLRGGWQPSLSLELALAESLGAPNEPTPRPAAPPPAATVHAKPQPASVSQQEPPRKLEPSDNVSKDEISSSSQEEAQAPRPVEKSAISAADVIRARKLLASSPPKTQANLSALLNSVKMIDV